jgi:hypothetical protein
MVRRGWSGVFRASAWTILHQSVDGRRASAAGQQKKRRDFLVIHLRLCDLFNDGLVHFAHVGEGLFVRWFPWRVWVLFPSLVSFSARTMVGCSCSVEPW